MRENGTDRGAPVSVRRLAGAVRSYRSLAAIRGGEVLVLPPATAGSLGDQALVQAVQDHLPVSGRSALRQVLFKDFAPQPLRAACRPPLILFRGSRASWLSYLRRLAHARCFLIAGADVMDGRYGIDQTLHSLDLADIACAAGVPTSVLGFSFSDAPEPAAVARLRAANPEISFNLRDPVSLQRFEAATGRPAQLVADMAFSLQPALQDPPATSGAAWIDRQRADGCVIVGLNANVLTRRSDHDAVIGIYAETIAGLHREIGKVAFLLIPHDFRPEQSDARTLNSIAARLPADIAARVRPVSDPLAAWEVKALAAKLDLVVTGRMHLAIAALGSGVAPLCISYVGKFEGLMAHFGIDGLVVEPDAAYRPGVLLDRALQAFRARLLHRERIAAALPRVRDLAEKNFEILSSPRK